MPKSLAWDDRTGTFVQSVIRISVCSTNLVFSWNEFHPKGRIDTENTGRCTTVLQ